MAYIYDSHEYTGNPATFTDTHGTSRITNISVPFSPIQDLHGYANPWPAGGGKNKLNPLATYKGCAYNTAVGNTLNPVAADKSWQDAGNDTFTISNLGSWSQACLISDPLPLGKAYLKISNVRGAVKCSVYVCNGDFKVNRVSYNRNPVPDGETITANTTFTNDDTYFVVYLAGSGADASIQYPYAYSGDTAATDSFSPYSNICPISGRTGLSVYDDPKYGGTIEWNQLVQNGNFASTSGWSSVRGTQSVSNNELTYTVTELGGGGLQNRTLRSISFPKGHKVFVALEYYAAKAFKVIVGLFGATGREFTLSDGVTPNVWNSLSTICQNDAADVTGLRLGSPSTYGSMAVGDTYKFRNVILVDLTKMFGAGNEPSTVEECRALFPKDYYAYNTGETTCVSAVNGDPYWKKEIDWTTSAGTVYGGTLDVVTGVLTVDMANIASYNGEVINEPWLSSMDEYAPGATPTTGAQVVYELATPLTYQLTGQEVAVIKNSVNNVWADTGNSVTVTVFDILYGFQGWLIKVGSGMTLIPTEMIQAETYKASPNQRMEESAERDVSGYLWRNTVANQPPKIEFETPPCYNADVKNLNDILKAAYSVPSERKLPVAYYDNEEDCYKTADCYIPNIDFPIRTIDIENKVIFYDPIRYAFIGY